MTRRNRRPRFNGSDDDHAATELLASITPAPGDGATYEEPPAPWRPAGERFADPSTWRGENDLHGDEAAIDRIRAAGRAAWDQRPAGLSDIGVMASGVMVVEVTGPAPLAGYQPAPARFPALPSAPEPAPVVTHVLAPVPVTEPAKFGDAIRLPQVWCDMPRCISFHRDPASLGERDARDRAIADGWRYDALGRFACPDCQQTRSDYRTPQPVAWHHPEVARRWHAREPLTDTGAFRLGVEAELGRRVSYENPALARAIAGATHRTAGAS